MRELPVFLNSPGVHPPRVAVTINQNGKVYIVLDKQTTTAPSTVSEILSYVTATAECRTPPIINLQALSVTDAAQFITLLPGEPETAAAYQWTRAGSTGSDPDTKAKEIEEALAALKVLEKMDLPEPLRNKIWEDQHTLRTRAMRVYRAMWDIRFKSARWSRRRIEQTLDQEKARMWWVYTLEMDEELKYLISRQIERFTNLQREADAL